GLSGLRAAVEELPRFLARNVARRLHLDGEIAEQRPQTIRQVVGGRRPVVLVDPQAHSNVPLGVLHHLIQVDTAWRADGSRYLSRCDLRSVLEPEELHAPSLERHGLPRAPAGARVQQAEIVARAVPQVGTEPITEARDVHLAELAGAGDHAVRPNQLQIEVLLVD